MYTDITITNWRARIHAGEASHDRGPAFAVTPDTLLLNHDGQVKFTETSFDSVRNKDYVPPEWNPREYFSDEQIEKIYVFALGVSVYNAADHNLDKDEVISCFIFVFAGFKAFLRNIFVCIGRAWIVFKIISSILPQSTAFVLYTQKVTWILKCHGSSPYCTRIIAYKYSVLVWNPCDSF